MPDLTTDVIVPIVAALIIALLSRWDKLFGFTPESVARGATIRFLRKQFSDLDRLFTLLKDSTSNRMGWFIESAFVFAPVVVGSGLVILYAAKPPSALNALLVPAIFSGILPNAVRSVAHRTETAFPTGDVADPKSWASTSLRVRIVRGCAVLYFLVLFFAVIFVGFAVSQEGFQTALQPWTLVLEFIALDAFNGYNMYAAFATESGFVEDRAFQRFLASPNSGLPVELSVAVGSEKNVEHVRGVFTGIGRVARIHREDGYDEEVRWSTILRCGAPVTPGVHFASPPPPGTG